MKHCFMAYEDHTLCSHYSQSMLRFYYNLLHLYEYKREIAENAGNYTFSLLRRHNKTSNKCMWNSRSQEQTLFICCLKLLTLLFILFKQTFPDSPVILITGNVTLVSLQFFETLDRQIIPLVLQSQVGGICSHATYAMKYVYNYQKIQLQFSTPKHLFLAASPKTNLPKWELNGVFPPTCYFMCP